VTYTNAVVYISKGPANLQPKPEKRRNKDINGQEKYRDLECVNDTIPHFRSASLFLTHKKEYPPFFPLFYNSFKKDIHMSNWNSKSSNQTKLKLGNLT